MATLSDKLRETAQNKNLEKEQEQKTEKERKVEEFAQRMQKEVPPLVAKAHKACLEKARQSAQEGFFSGVVSVFFFDNNQDNVDLNKRNRDFEICQTAATEVVKLLQTEGFTADVKSGSHCNDDSGTDYLYVSIYMSWEKQDG